MSDLKNNGAKSLAAKIAQISGEIDKIAKSGTNKEQGYKYIEYALVAGKIRELCAKYNIAIIPQVDSYDVSEATSRTGSKGFHYLTQMSFLLVNGDAPDEREERRWTSEATDFGDKGMNKSITAGEKYFIMRLFHISEKDSEDADSTTPDEIQTIQRPAPSNRGASEKQLGYLRSLYKQGGVSDSEIDKYISAAKEMSGKQVSMQIEKVKARLEEKQGEDNLPEEGEV